MLRDQQILSIFDWLSLLVCLHLKEEKVVPEVPASEGKVPIKLTPLDSAARRVKLEPWPFRVPTLTVVCEGRRLLKTFQDQEKMREALKAASRITMVTELVPGQGL